MIYRTMPNFSRSKYVIKFQSLTLCRRYIKLFLWLCHVNTFFIIHNAATVPQSELTVLLYTLYICMSRVESTHNRLYDILTVV